MADYPPNEIIDMIMVLGESQNNFSIATTQYALRFPARRHPCRKTFRHLTLRARNGHLVRRRQHREYDENDPRVLTILALIYLDRHISSRDIERYSGIHQRTVIRILKKRKFHPYHITLTQALSAADMIARVNFCNWAQQRIQQDPDFFNYVCFSDEATFRSNGQVNKHNCHYWAEENPHWFRPIDHQHRWSLNVWCGIINGYLVGPYFFENTVTGLNFLPMLRDHFPEILENVDLQTRERMWIQLDGAGPHYANVVRNYLNEHYNGRWIGRGGPIAWPARSPDLTSPDFYLWGFLKAVVYRQPPTTREDMMERIRAACAAITQNVLLGTVRNFRRRLELCLQQNGGNFEQLINR